MGTRREAFLLGMNAGMWLLIVLCPLTYLLATGCSLASPQAAGDGDAAIAKFDADEVAALKSEITATIEATMAGFTVDVGGVGIDEADLAALRTELAAAIEVAYSEAFNTNQTVTGDGNEVGGVNDNVTMRIALGLLFGSQLLYVFGTRPIRRWVARKLGRGVGPTIDDLAQLVQQRLNEQWHANKAANRGNGTAGGAPPKP